LKIAQVCPRYYPDIGGVETHVREISERLVKNGHEVEVITTDPTGKLRKKEFISGVEVTRFRSLAPGDAYYLAPQMYPYIKKNDFDIVHIHSYHAFPALFAVLAKPKGKFIFTPHYHRSGHTFFRNLLHKPYRFLGRILFSRADRVICVSEYERELLTEDFAISDKIIKIPNGINLEEFQNLQRKQKGTSERILLYVGRLEEYKGVQYIIRALPHLPDFRLQIVGKGLYEEELRKFASQAGVADRIEWLKDISRHELLQRYACADIFMMLSKHEAYGITVAEALAAETPCIVAKGSALDEFADGNMCIGITDPITDGKLVESIRYLNQLPDFEEPKDKKIILDWKEVTGLLEDIYKC
jgi:glycosyltransferase involved in cell wall biosynthesis